MGQTESEPEDYGPKTAASGKLHHVWHVWHHTSHANHAQPHSHKQWWVHYTCGGNSCATIVCGTTNLP